MGNTGVRHQQKKPHAAAVTMPAKPLEDRQDYPDLIAALGRADGSAVAIGVIAARFRLPCAVVQGLAMNTHAIPRRMTDDPARACAQVLLKPWPSARSEFMANAVAGRMTPEDQAYMARTLMQLSDECAELRERVKALEMAFKSRGNE